MKITHVVCTDNFAGVERHVATLAAAQHDAGHEVTVLGGRQERMRAEIDRPRVNLRPAPDRRTAARHLLGAAGREADVVATHMTDADMVALTCPALAGTPIVSTRHFAAHRGATPSHRWVAERAEGKLAAEIAVSEFVAHSVGVDSTVVLPGIPDRDNPLETSGREPFVLVAQRLQREKATDVAILAFAESGLAHRGWRLVLAGEGAHRDQLTTLAADLGIGSSVDFLGYRSDLQDLMSRASLFCATATAEPMGLSVLEAMASGLPVVASAAGGHLESVGAANGAALFAPGDARAAGELLAQLADDPELRDAYGNSLRARQRESFSIAAQVRATDEVYRHALVARSGSAPRTDQTDRHLVVASLEPWDRVWRRNQHLISGLLRDDPSLRVLFVEPGTDPLHGLRRGTISRPGRGLRRGPHLPGVDPDALWLLEPTKLLPRRVDPQQDERWAELIQRTAEQIDLAHPTLWVNDPRGAEVTLRTGWPTLYDITDDWLEADRDPATQARLARQESVLMDRASEVVVCSSGLVSSKSRVRPVTLVPNAVDGAITRPTARPEDLPAGPVALYLGTQHADRLDVALCVATAQALGREATLVLVGPDALTTPEREQLDAAGVLRLGPRDRRSVPAYLQHADVLVVPHVVDSFTDSLDPIKLYEYRAVGRPVVSTPVAGFREAVSDRIQVVGPEGFPAAVRSAVPATDRFPHGADPDVPTWVDRVSEMRAVLDRVAVGDESGRPQRTVVPLAARVRLGHSAIQHLADQESIDILHIKGYALHPSLVHDGRSANDVDVLVRPDHVTRLLQVLELAGFARVARFATSSPFEHSTTFFHDLWGYVDVHRHYPGFGLPAELAFERLWRDHGEATIGGRACPVPAVPAQALMLILHAARSRPDAQPSRDVEHVWTTADEDARRAIEGLVEELGAHVPFAAGTGDVDALPPSAEKDLWHAVARPDDRVREWRARIAAAPGTAARLRLLVRLPLVNTDHLASQLGRRPSWREVAVEFVARGRRAIAEQRRRP